ncbi:MAG: hypothetical protein SW019_19205 [Actinomycetota bacterium]|nr:hypothetical protein [Actinomycetota bacterium]
MKFIDAYVRSPFAGLAPWILMAVVNGPGRFEEAASAGLALAVLTLWVGRRRGVPVHLIEAFTTLYFAALAVLGAAASPAVISWLELWAGELSNVALAVFVVVTVAIRRPFTLAYAKDTTPQEHWDAPLFLRINYVISAFWGGAFVVSALAGGYGDLVLADNDNFWTAWIIPIGMLVWAVSFTEFYPDYATAKALREAGESAEPVPSLLGVFDWFPPFLTVIGIVALVSDALPVTSSVVLITVGAAGWALLSRRTAKA